MSGVGGAPYDGRMTTLAIGAHVDQTDPLAEAAARKAPLVQFFLGDPQSYKGPVFKYAGGGGGGVGAGPVTVTVRLSPPP